jgi:hypothetical protein
VREHILLQTVSANEIGGLIRIRRRTPGDLAIIKGPEEQRLENEK